MAATSPRSPSPAGSPAAAPESAATAADATRERILDTAERRFAADGFSGASLRQITIEAGVNLAAVNYHFGSKEDLYAQVFARRIVPINERRLALLAAAEAAAGGRPLALDAILESLLGPVFEMAGRAPSFLPLLARNIGAPPPFMAAMLESHFRPLVERYRGVLARSLPGLPPQTLFWRMHFVVGAMLHCASHHFIIHKISGGLCRPEDTETMVAQLIAFAAAGMQAPVPGALAAGEVSAGPRQTRAGRPRTTRRPAR